MAQGARGGGQRLLLLGVAAGPSSGRRVSTEQRGRGRASGTAAALLHVACSWGQGCGERASHEPWTSAASRQPPVPQVQRALGKGRAASSPPGPGPARVPEPTRSPDPAVVPGGRPQGCVLSPASASPECVLRTVPPPGDSGQQLPAAIPNPDPHQAVGKKCLPAPGAAQRVLETGSGTSPLLPASPHFLQRLFILKIGLTTKSSLESIGSLTPAQPHGPVTLSLCLRGSLQKSPLHVTPVASGSRGHACGTRSSCPPRWVLMGSSTHQPAAPPPELAPLHQ